MNATWPTTWVDRLQDVAEKNPSQLVIVVADMARSDLRLSSSFVAEFCQRLARSNPALHLARGWIEQRLAEQGESIEQLVHGESQRQASDQVSVSHSIASLRVLSAIDWKEFVETLSLVEQTLRGDPADVYAGMDFATRDRYRHIVEAMARHSRLAEIEVAQKGDSSWRRKAHREGQPRRPPCACRLLPGRQGPAFTGTGRRSALALDAEDQARPASFSVFLLCRWNPGLYHARDFGLPAPGGGARSGPLAAHLLRAHLLRRGESVCGRAPQLARHPAGFSPLSAAPRLLVRRSLREPDHGGGPDDAEQPRRCGRVARDDRDSLPGESRFAPPLCPSDRLGRCADGDLA